MTAIIETERLTLRRFEATDLDAYHAIFSHPKVARWLLPCDGRDEAMRNMAMVEGFWQLQGASMMAVCERADGTLIGRCGPWHPEVMGGAEVEVGWTIHPDRQGRGYASEAARAAVAYAFERFAVPRVVHMIEDGNAASQAVAGKIGSARTGETVTHPIAGEVAIWAQDRP